MSTAVCDDGVDDSNVHLDSGRDDYGVADGHERSAILTPTCDINLLETDLDDAALAESIIRARTSLHHSNRNVTSSQASTDPISSTEFDDSSLNDSSSQSRGASHSKMKDENSLSGYTAASSDDPSADFSPAYAEESENAKPRLEGAEKSKEFENLAKLRWSATVDALPVLPRDSFQKNSTHAIVSPYEQRSTVITESARQSNYLRDISAEVDHEDVIHVSEPEAATAVAVPVPTDTEPVDAVAVSIVKRNGKTALSIAKSRKSTLLVCLIVAIFIAVSAVVAGICGSGGCANSRSPENNNLPFSPSPSLAKPDDRKISLFSYINNVTYYGRILSPSDDDFTPEGKALEWLADSDPLQLVPENDSFRIRQRYALLTFWFYSNNTDSWENSTGWLDYDDECTWFGISCTTIDHGSDTGSQMTVTIFNLKFNGISGNIPPDLGLLSNLQYLGLNSNNLFGSIPSSIGQLTDLEMLRLQIQINGQLTGQIPESIGNLHHLIIADFSYNSFTGQLPSSIGNWTDLEYIDFSGLPINSTIPSSVGNWKNVGEVLFMMVAGNMHGPLPESIGNWLNIRRFSVVGNSFSGTLPPTMAYWKNLQEIDLSFNDFSGTIPDSFLNWTSIETMYLYLTELTGGLPEGMCTLPNLTTVQADCLSKKFTCSCCNLCV